ncbi:MAG: DUF4268 domain-containing protein [Pyrinomonadaceae bacterium]|nr:DUF4268 domain-containing protein [Pyrinomonadaceae bacterium]
MNPGIFLIQDNDELVEMNEQAYDSEDLLQTLLAKYPSLLAGSQIDAKAPRKWLLIGREFGVPSEEGGADQWSLDHLFLDQDAIPTIVEVKRSTNTTIRREIVGQMLDYAANAVVYWPVDRIRSRFETNCERQGFDPEERLRDFLESVVEPEEFWQKANTNLQAGKIRLLFIADEIPTKLQRIVEFLNEQMNPAEVLAIEIKQFVGQGLRGLVPRVIGQTAEAIEKSPISEVGQIQLEFWTAFKSYMDGTSKIACPKPAPQSWMNHSIGVGGFGLSSIASTWSSETSSYEHPEIRAEFWMNGSDFRTLFGMLEAQRSEIESEVGQGLVWDNSPEKKRSRKIYMRKSADFLDQTKWPEQHEWLRVSLEKLNRVFAPRVKNLDGLRVSASTQSP